MALEVNWGLGVDALKKKKKPYRVYRVVHSLTSIPGLCTHRTHCNAHIQLACYNRSVNLQNLGSAPGRHERVNLILNRSLIRCEKVMTML